MFKFIGNGSCFNVKSGNTSAYYYNEDSEMLFLIDCGESVFERLVKKFINFNKVIVIITHFHSDHIGSLPSFIFYCNIAMCIKPIIVFPNESIVELLKKMGVDESYYVYQKTCSIIDTQLEVVHKEDIQSFGYVFKIGNQKAYYSGDSKELPNAILTSFLSGDIDIMYHDMTRYEGTCHAHVKYMADIIPESLRKNVYAMHLDDKKTKKLAIKNGFKIAK